MIRYRLLAATALSALLWGAPAAAQVNLDSAAPDGKVFAGTLTSEDEPSVFTVSLPAGQGLEIEALPVGSSDPQIKVFEGNSRTPMAENDDRPGTVAARVRLFSETAKSLRVEVSASPAGPELAADARFRLVVLPSDYRPVPPRDLVAGTPVTGELESGDEHLFRIRGQSGQTWVISLNAPGTSALDPMLEIFSGESTDGDALASDDDGGGELNARLRFRIPRNGIYTVRASAIGGSGPYRLDARIDQPGAPSTAALGTLDFARAVSDVIGDDAEEKLYRLSDTARRRIAGGDRQIVLDMLAEEDSEFDPMLEAGFQTPLGFSAAVSDDDGGENLNARLTIDLTGFDTDWLDRFRIKASSAVGNEGAYELRMAVED